jgi:effector protein SdbA
MQSDKKYGGFYRLIPPSLTLWGQLKQFAWNIVRLPYSIYQTIVGRLLSYLVINPLFRQEEKDDALILQHPKHPDPLFTKEDEMSVINVYPKKHFLIRIVINWHNFLINHLTAAKIANSLLGKLFNLLPKGEHYIDKYLDHIVDKVAKRINGTKGAKIPPSQIHFRGIEKLSPDQQEAFYDKLQQRFKFDFHENRKRIYFYSLQTADNAILDSVEVRNPGATEQDIKDRHFIVTSMPRSNNFVDWLKHYQIYAKELNVTVIAFNYRGVGIFSKGITTNEEDLYYDAYSQVQRLLKLGVKPENISTMGECLGGNVATHTAATLQEEGLPIKLFSARSFRSLTSILEGRSRPEEGASLWHPKTWLQWLLYGAVKLIFNPIIRSAGWSLDIDNKFTVIPPHDRDYLVARSKKDENGNHFADDMMVPHKYASTYSLAKERFKLIDAKRTRGEELSDIEKEWLNDSPGQHKFHVSEEQHTDASKANGHTVHPRLLVSTYPRPDASRVDGRQYTLNFFKRIWPKKEQVDTDLELVAPTGSSCSF